jgi:hypothetical protein
MLYNFRESTTNCEKLNNSMEMSLKYVTPRVIAYIILMHKQGNCLLQIIDTACIGPCSVYHRPVWRSAGTEKGLFVYMYTPKFFFGKKFNEICPENCFKQIKRREASEAQSHRCHQEHVSKSLSHTETMCENSHLTKDHFSLISYQNNFHIKAEPLPILIHT